MLHIPTNMGPSGSWGPSCVPSKSNLDTTERLKSGYSDAPTAATAPSASTTTSTAAAGAAGASWLPRCPLCCCSFSACCCSAAAISAQRERLKQQQELLQQRRQLLQQQHEQLEREGSLQRQRKVLLQQELESNHLGAPLGSLSEGQVAQRHGDRGSLRGGSPNRPHTASKQRPLGEAPVSSKDSCPTWQQQQQQTRSCCGEGDRRDSNTLAKLLGPRLYAAYKRLESKGLQGPPECLPTSSLLIPLEPSPAAAAPAAADMTPAAAAAADLCSEGHLFAASTAGGTAAVLPRSCTEEVMLQRLSSVQQQQQKSVLSPNPHMAAPRQSSDLAACSRSSFNNASCQGVSNLGCRDVSCVVSAASCTDINSTGKTDLNQLVFYGWDSTKETIPPGTSPQKTPGGLIAPCSNKAKSERPEPLVAAAARGLEKGAPRGPPTGGKPHCGDSRGRASVAEWHSQRGDSVDEWRAPLRKISLVSTVSESPNPVAVSPLFVEKPQNETRRDQACSEWSGAPASLRALTAIVADLQARLAAAEQQKTHNFVGCLRRELALRQLQQHFSRQEGGACLQGTLPCQSQTATQEETAEALKEAQQQLQFTETERGHLKEALKQKHMAEMELRAQLSSLSTLNEQLQAEASTLMSFHRLAEVHGQDAAEKLLLQQLRTQAELQTCRVKELEGLLSSRDAEISALRGEVTVCRQVVEALASGLEKIPHGHTPEAQPRRPCKSQGSQTEAPSAQMPAGCENLPDTWHQPPRLMHRGPQGLARGSWDGRQRQREMLLHCDISEFAPFPVRTLGEPERPSQTERDGERQRKTEKETDAVNRFSMGAWHSQESSRSIMRFTVKPSDGYSPTADDSIDSAVAAISNARTNKVLFTRLCKGVYLYGHLAVLMHLGPAGELQINFEGKDYAAREFIRIFEEKEFRYLTTRQNDSGRALSLEVCPEGAGASQTPAITNRSLIHHQHEHHQHHHQHQQQNKQHYQQQHQHEQHPREQQKYEQQQQPQQQQHTHQHEQQQYEQHQHQQQLCEQLQQQQQQHRHQHEQQHQQQHQHEQHYHHQHEQQRHHRHEHEQQHQHEQHHHQQQQHEQHQHEQQQQHQHQHEQQQQHQHQHEQQQQHQHEEQQQHQHEQQHQHQHEEQQQHQHEQQQQHQHEQQQQQQHKQQHQHHDQQPQQQQHQQQHQHQHQHEQPEQQLSTKERIVTRVTRAASSLSEARKGPFRCATLKAGTVAASGAPQVSAGHSSSSCCCRCRCRCSTSQGGSASKRIQSCRLLPRSPVALSRCTPSGGSQRRHQGASAASQAVFSAPLKSPCFLQSRLKVPKTGAGPAPAAPAPAKSKGYRGAASALLLASNGPATPAGGHRGNAHRQRSRLLSAAVQQL